MTNEERWTERYNEVVKFILTNKRNPSKYDATERGLYLNWLKHNRKFFNKGELKEGSAERFRELIALTERYRHVNQYV